MKKKKPNAPPASLAASASDRLFHDMKVEAARTLAADPQNARALAQAIASATTGSDPEDELCELCELLTITLDVARMAHENGQYFGTQCLDALSQHLSALSRKGAVTLDGSMAITRCYVKAGLPAPEDIAPDEHAVMEETSSISHGDEEQPEAAFAAILGEILSSVGDDPSMLHQTFAEVLPGIPAVARRTLCRLATANPDRRFEPLGCAWLLDPSEPVRSGAIDGLHDRLTAGNLSTQALGRLAVLRTWIVDEPIQRRVDTLVKDAIRSGVSPDHESLPSHRVVECISSTIDGTGTQSFGIALQKGRARSLALVLLKQGLGIKDAFVIPCTSAAEQRDILQQMSWLGGKSDVSLAYIRTALSIALADGLANGMCPAPGLVDVVDMCAITALRPADDASVQTLLDQYDPENDLASLDAEACETLVAVSGDWAVLCPVVTSWFADNDDIVDTASSATARENAVWAWLETHRNFWASLIARMALLLKEQDDPLSRSFAMTAREMIRGRPLQKIPIIFRILKQTLASHLASCPMAEHDMPEGFDEHDPIMAPLLERVAMPPETSSRSSRSKTPRKNAPRKRT